MTSAPHRPPGLVRELQRSHVFTLYVLAGVLLLTLLTSSYLVMSQVRLDHDTTMVRSARDARDGMVDQETGLRGWLATGDEVFLEPYVQGRQTADRAFRQLQAGVERTPELAPGVVDLLVNRERFDVWADEASDTRVGNQESDRIRLASFLLEGKTIFDAYRATDDATLRALQGRREAAVRGQAIAVGVSAVGTLLVLAASAVVTVRRRRRLRASLLRPIDQLMETISALRAGDLDVQAVPSGVRELDQIGTEMGRLARDLRQARSEAAAREARLVLLAERFEAVVRVSREVAGSLSIRYVSRAVTSAASDLLDTPTALWMPDLNRRLTVVDRSDDPHGVVPPPALVAPEAVTLAAADARTVVADGRLAHPLVLAGAVVAVLESESTTIDEDAQQVLAPLLATAAAALESAHLHSAARELADVDSLTRLANRRRFEVDIDDEWERCRRYGRPLSVVMLDLDHFKQFNDEHGHLLGDEVLREAATAIAGTTRSTDTAYRYGGEEVVVLLRETGLEEAAVIAERLRAAVRAVHITGYHVEVTTSAGVAARHASMSHYTELIAVADRALYAAKRAGRDRVVTSAASSAPALGAADHGTGAADELLARPST